MESAGLHKVGERGKGDFRMTNADRIRAMSDEELVQHIWNKFGCPDGRNYITCWCMGSCKDCWLDWLRQQAEED